MRARLIVLAALAMAVIAAAVVIPTRGPTARAGSSGSTLRATFVDRTGDGILERGPGARLLDRTELAPRSHATRQLALFAQLTDVHLADIESPARLEPLDRLGPPFTSAFRPQEALTGRVLAAGLRSLGRLRPQAVIESGDLIDNDQQNELVEGLAILHGGRVDPRSGARRYEGVQAASDPDPLYYRPAVDPPVHGGLLREAERPFVSPGLRAPWYPVLGNHDVLVQGNIPPTPRTRRLAVGSRKLVELDPATIATASAQRLDLGAIDSLLARGLPGRTLRITADPRRRELSPAETLAALRHASGHGGSGPLLDYTFGLGRHVRCIVLDTTSRLGGAGGVVRPGQVRWLRSELRASGARWVLVFSHAPLASSAGGAAALALLDRDSHVVAAIAGHTHVNSIVPRHSRGGGYWLITTASLVDYPQQVRAFRLLQTAGGGVVLRTWLLDTDPSDKLASIARQLSYLDYQGGRPNRFAGPLSARNASLYR